MNAEPFDDFSGNFAPLRRELWSAENYSYKIFLKSLKPDYRKIGRDIALGYLALAVTLLVTAAMPAVGVWAGVAAGVGAVSVGYWIAYLQLFIHEGAHYNLAPTRAKSDRICNLLIAWMIGTNVAAYRTVHFQHHRALGTPEDSEHSYFFPLNLTFFVKGLFGIRAAEVVFARKSTVADAAERQVGSATDLPFNWALVAAPIVHGGIVAIAYWLGYWWVSIAWLVGVGMVFPFLGALRQVLEHRDENAMPDTDFTKISHGAITRLFPDGAFSSTFGGAGFNRHLLHHWEPSISYTNLSEFERFLMQTPARAYIERRRTTYMTTFLKLLSL